MSRAVYASDLSDAEWAQIEDMVPKVKPGGRPAKYERREIMNAIFYQVQSGGAWRLLPHDLPPWRIVFYYYSAWRKVGLFERMNEALRGQVRERVGRKLQPSAAVADSQSVKTTEKGGRRAMTGASW